MFTDPSLILARVRHRHEPARPAAFVVVPQDHGIRFALEGPDPAQDMQWDRRYLSREQALDANTLLRLECRSTRAARGHDRPYLPCHSRRGPPPSDRARGNPPRGA